MKIIVMDINKTRALLIPDSAKHRWLLAVCHRLAGKYGSATNALAQLAAAAPEYTETLDVLLAERENADGGPHRDGGNRGLDSD